jgi:hypothetical protein
MLSSRGQWAAFRTYIPFSAKTADTLRDRFMSVTQAMLLVIGAGVAGNIDNIIRPLVYRRVGNLHPMITLVGAFLGVRYLGILGMLFGPLFIAYLFELVHFYREEYESPTPVAVAPPPVATVTARPITASA